MRIRMGMPLQTLGLSVLVALAVVAVGLALNGCGGSNGGGGPTSARTIAVTPAAQTGTTVDAKVGDTIVVSLDANPTTGYEWTFTSGDTFTIASSKYEPDPNSAGAAGAGGTQVVTLKVTKAGSSNLTGVYARGWETPKPNARPTFSMTVVSTD